MDDDKPLFDLGALFGDERVNHGDPDEDYEWKWPGNEDRTPVKLHLADGSTHLMAQFVWQSSLTMSELICKGRINVKDKVVLEVGAGAALPSIVSQKCDAKFVLVTDYPEAAIIDNMNRNVNENVDENQSTIKVAGFLWGENIESVTTVLPADLDVILLADTLWMDSQHHNLLRSLRDLSNIYPNVQAIFTFMNHDDGRGIASQFFNLALSEYGFRVTESDTIDWRANSDKFDENEDPENFGEYGPVHFKVLVREVCQE